MLKKILLPLLAAPLLCCAQAEKEVITLSEAKRIENFLAADELRGRRTGSPEIDKAAAFIADEFKTAGLQPWNGKSFLQEFVMVRPRLKELKFKADGAGVDTKNVIVVTTQASLEADEKSGYEVRRITADGDFFQQVRTINGEKKNLLVLVDSAHAANFPQLTGLKRQLFASSYSKVFLLGSSVPANFKLKAEHNLEETRFANVVGILPARAAGKMSEEQVIFSSHYDHIGVGKPVNGDSIYNGANDDAAGTTAVVLLAKKFRQSADNNRTLVFAAFTAEEIGGLGSQYFSEQMNPEKVVAMFNIEMIGTESKWGKNSAYITGYELTDFGAILQKNLQGSAFQFHPDPYLKENLFYRSDNATLARKGVAAHTISTAKMEGEPNYHQRSDEVSTLDLDNMVQIIQAIWQSSRSVVNGKNTPSRVKAGTVH